MEYYFLVNSLIFKLVLYNYLTNYYVLLEGKKIDSWYFIDWNTGEKHTFMNFEKQGEICTAIASKSILLSKSGMYLLLLFHKFS